MTHFPTPLYSREIEYLGVYPILSYWLKTLLLLTISFSFLSVYLFEHFTKDANVLVSWAFPDIFKLEELWFVSSLDSTNKEPYLVPTESSWIINLEIFGEKIKKNEHALVMQSSSCHLGNFDMFLTGGPRSPISMSHFLPCSL